MNIVMKTAFSTLLIVLSVSAVGSAQTGDALPTADDVVAKMIQLDNQRHAQLQGYTATRHYVAVNKHHRAEMLVRVACAGDGVKRFTILSEDGSHYIRKHVFYKMLNEEAAVSRRGTRESTRITPANYDFEVIGQDSVDGRPAYVLSVSPKAENKYLIDGEIWVDATDYSIVRVEGRPARNPSFWTRSVHFVHTYQKVGPFWLAASTDSVSEIRIFGTAELTIENSGYTLNPRDIQTTDTDTEARLAQ
jgi:outer membrane lipoprotein-sorting protein